MCAHAAGIKAAICELPFARKASDTEGGAGGTCVLRGCVPKKLMVYGGEFAEAFKDSVGFGCVPIISPHSLPLVDRLWQIPFITARDSRRACRACCGTYTSPMAYPLYNCQGQPGSMHKVLWNPPDCRGLLRPEGAVTRSYIGPERGWHSPRCAVCGRCSLLLPRTAGKHQSVLLNSA